MSNCLALSLGLDLDFENVNQAKCDGKSGYVYCFDSSVVKPLKLIRLSTVSKIVLTCMTVAQLSRSWRMGRCWAEIDEKIRCNSDENTKVDVQDMA